MAQVCGDATGLTLPATVAELAAAGPDWLTHACRAFGAVGTGNAISQITACTPVSGGNSGQKARLQVIWAKPDPALDNHLFVKLSRDFADPFRDRRKQELEAEVRLAALSRHPAFPVAVAKPYFADFAAASGTGLLISAEIAYGTGTIEPARRKCRDSELADPLAWYRATITALARLAAADLAGRLSPDVDRLFPYDPVAAAADMPFPWDVAGLTGAVRRYADLSAQAPQLFPAAIRSPAFIRLLESDALAYLHHQAALRRFLHADDRLIALTHWNTNLDNAWFERKADGSLTAGLLDWGMARRMNAGYGLWGGLSAAEPAMLLSQLDTLLAHYASELAAHGGPAIDPATVGRHFDLSLGLLGVALMMDVPALLLSRMPAIITASGPQDPMIAADGVVQGFLTVFTNFLLLWQHRQLGRSLAKALGQV